MINRIGAALVLICLATPSMAQTHEDQWNRCKSEENHDLAMGACTALIQSGTETDANLSTLFMNRGVSYNMKGEPERALKDFEVALSLDRTNVKVYFNRAFLFIGKKDFDAALREAERALQVQPGYGLAHAIRGEVFRRRGRFADATPEIDKALSASAADRWIQLHGQTLRQINEAAKRCGDANTDLSIGACTSIINDTTMTPAAVANAYNTRAVAHGRNDNWEQVVLDHDESIRLNPSSPVFFANRGIANFRVGNHEQAERDFERSLSLDPKGLAAANGQGLVARQQKDYARAVERFTVAIAAAPRPPTDANATYIANRGLTYLLMERYDEALVDLNGALSISPKSAFALYSRGVLRIRQGDAAAGEADIAAAKAVQGDIEAYMARRHLTR